MRYFRIKKEFGGYSVYRYEYKGGTGKRRFMSKDRAECLKAKWLYEKLEPAK